MRAEASPVRTLVIDEVSMMGAKFYARVEQYFRSARDAGDTAFGGINVYLFGDFSQVRRSSRHCMHPIVSRWLGVSATTGRAGAYL